MLFVQIDVHKEKKINKQTTKTRLRKTKGKFTFWEDGNTVQKK